MYFIKEYKNKNSVIFGEVTANPKENHEIIPHVVDNHVIYTPIGNIEEMNRVLQEYLKANI